MSDGAEDPECTFADLGEAVRKIRIDFAIPIEFGTMTIYPRSPIVTPEESWLQLRSRSYSLLRSRCS